MTYWHLVSVFQHTNFHKKRLFTR